MKTTTAIVFLMGSLFGGVAESQEISPILFGQNHWMADGDEGRVGYLHELWDKVAESGSASFDLWMGSSNLGKEKADRLPLSNPPLVFFVTPNRSR